MTSEILARLLDGRHLKQDEATDLMDAIMSGKVSPVSMAAILMALRTKGETVDEITGFARSMRRHVVPVVPRRGDLVDTCGTGGDASGTFNISTGAAIVAAAMGIAVAKHGNRAVSSRSGSADVLEALGVNVDLDPRQAADLIDTMGLGFLYAPKLHPAMKHAGPVRRELRVRTVFNLLGPLTNPAGADRQLLGVYLPELCEPVCRVLKELGSQRAFVVHGAGGLDEVSPCGPTTVAALQDGRVHTFTFTPEEAGIQPVGVDELQGGTPRDNARLLEKVFQGKEDPRTDAVVLNAGFAAVLAGKAADFGEGVALARQAVSSGAAMAKLDELREASRRILEEKTS
jgi:anthranilate phosphoribosyltransferase